MQGSCEASLRVDLGSAVVVANWTEELSEGDWLLLRPATQAGKDNHNGRMGNVEEVSDYTYVLLDEDRLSGRRLMRAERMPTLQFR